jgi:hypothetical protein
MILCLTASTVAGGHVEIREASAMGHISTRHYRCSRGRGKTACGRDKTTSNLTTIEYRLVTTLIAPATYASAAAAFTTPKSSTPRIVLVKAERVNLSNNLVHVLMHEILLRRKMRKLLFSALD